MYFRFLPLLWIISTITSLAHISFDMPTDWTEVATQGLEGGDGMSIREFVHKDGIADIKILTHDHVITSEYEAKQFVKGIQDGMEKHGYEHQFGQQVSLGEFHASRLTGVFRSGELDGEIYHDTYIIPTKEVTLTVSLNIHQDMVKKANQAELMKRMLITYEPSSITMEKATTTAMSVWELVGRSVVYAGCAVGILAIIRGSILRKREKRSAAS